MTAQANYTAAADVFAGWRDKVLTGKAPVFYPCGTGELGRLEIGPGLVTLFGGPPGGGKSALVMQLVVDALRLSPALRVLVCNIEMPPAVLLDRQLARVSGIDGRTIRYRRFGPEHADRLALGLGTLEPLAERLAFVWPPFNLENVAASADAFGADVLLLDYIQRIPPPGDHGDKRGSVDATMSFLRQFADAGAALIVVSSVSRGKDGRGRATYAGDVLNLASFRESAELEFGADDAFMLATDPKAGADVVTLRHLKSRHGETRDIALRFDKSLQRFTPLSEPTEWNPDGPAGVTPALRELWGSTPPAGNGDYR